MWGIYVTVAVLIALIALLGYLEFIDLPTVTGHCGDKCGGCMKCIVKEEDGENG